MVNRIAKLFPGEKFEVSEQSVLMNTIRVPKNILYLSDRLPKPTYAIASPEPDKRRSTTHDIGYGLSGLPEISQPKRPRPKKGRPLYGVDEGRRQQEIREEANDNEYAPAAVGQRAHLHKNPKPTKRAPPSDEQPDDEHASSKSKHSLSPSLPLNAGKEDHQTAGEKEKNQDNERMPLIPIHKDMGKQGKRGRAEEAKDGYNGEYNSSPYIQDAYIHQLVGRKNPIVRPLNGNLKRIADIYSGNNAQHIISIHKR